MTCLNKIEELGQKGVLGGLTEEETGLKLEAEQDYNRLLRMEEISWKEKSRATWLKEGDRNTNFFLKMTNLRCSTNTIDRLIVEGGMDL